MARRARRPSREEREEGGGGGEGAEGPAGVTRNPDQTQFTAVSTPVRARPAPSASRVSDP